ncbi:hypothetical protein CEP52_004230 [Fusarium oligoseptatum]|uniref:RNA helicase n=1 Tax=Fusarium oligoseptatum TaxID=2604345 RepID=A0A428U4D1_9HYPO|nr:hypothetical protein CEP52_004230 [Fusarium oligoseptatum]
MYYDHAMESLQRNQTTAAEAMALWIPTSHLMREEGRHKARRDLPIFQKRQDSSLYREEQVSDIYFSPSKTPSAQGPPRFMSRTCVVAHTGSNKTTQIPQFILYDELAKAMDLEVRKEHPLREGEHGEAPSFTMLRARRQLPVSQKRLLIPCHHEKVLVVVANTGSGKITETPQFVLYDEWGSGLKAIYTQPRRLAASSVAARVAKEMAVPLGQEVGYHVRFDSKMSDKTRLVYMTDGMLPVLNGFIVDEAHERTTTTDILMALIKRAISFRNDLKVVIISAALDAAKFQALFGGAKSLEVASRTLPVDVHHPDPTAHPPISKASAGQRPRRTKHGVCFRMYTKEALEDIFLASTPAGILMSPPTSEILKIKSLGFNAVGLFDRGSVSVIPSGRFGVFL